MLLSRTSSEALNNDVEKLKQYGADDIIVISNTYLIKNYILLSDFFEEL